jgi:hypothetical protein
MWEELNKKAVDLFQSSDYAEALEIGRKALEEAEKIFGPDDPPSNRKRHEQNCSSGTWSGGQ